MGVQTQDYHWSGAYLLLILLSSKLRSDAWKLHKNEKDIRKVASELIIQIYDIKLLREKHVGTPAAELDSSLSEIERDAFSIKFQ